MFVLSRILVLVVLAWAAEHRIQGRQLWVSLLDRSRHSDVRFIGVGGDKQWGRGADAKHWNVLKVWSS